MNTYTQKRILVIFTGGTIAGNVAKSNVSQNTKSEPNSFMSILKGAVDIVRKNWNIEIYYQTTEKISKTYEKNINEFIKNKKN